MSTGPETTPILVVDDNDELREFMVLSLREAGYGVEEATDGQAALEYLKTNGLPLLMILDIMMPRINGLEVLKRLEEEGNAPGKILVTSQLPHIEATLTRFKLPSVSFLEKPFVSEALLSKVASLLDS